MNLPVGQIETKRFPIVGERAPSPDISNWRLRVSGLVESERVLDLDQYETLNHRTLTFDIHCVTSWTRIGATFTGVPLSDLVAPLPGARFVSFGAYSDRDHHTSLPVEYALANTWVVHQFDGLNLTPEHGGPVRTVTPDRYFYKSIKWLRSVEVLAEDRLGWWETHSSYHNIGDPTTGEQRFTSGSLRPDQLERFLSASSYDKYKGRVLLGLDLRSWAPVSSDLSRLYLKNCNLTGVDLTGANMRVCNLSLSDLSDAQLSGADLSGSDLEGADFAGADLSDADLGFTALSATRFQGAKVSGARFEGAWGLVESQQAYLKSQGVSLTQQ